MNKWISVKDRMPEHSKSVLVYCPELNNIYCGDYRPESNSLFSEKDKWYYFVQGLGDQISEKVTHWMPLPEPPYKESE